MPRNAEHPTCPECGDEYEPEVVEAPPLRVFDVDVIEPDGVLATIQVVAHACDPNSSKAGHLLFLDVEPTTNSYWFRRVINRDIWRDVREVGSAKAGVGVH